MADLHLRTRAIAASVHLLISCVVAGLTAALILRLWYPWPFSELCGGRELFWLVVGVDITCGPLLTLIVFNARKPRRELVRDLSVIGLVQLSALAYGLHAVFVARPVIEVFEADRFRVLTTNELYTPEIKQAPAELRQLPLAGPVLIGTRRPRTAAEQLKAIDMGIQGVDVGQRPSFWQSYALSKPQVVARSRPISVLWRRYPKSEAITRSLLADKGVSPESVRFLPVISRTKSWVALIDAQGNILTYAAFDGFF